MTTDNIEISGPDLYMARLSIRSMAHCGKNAGSPFEVRLQPHFNAIIGGRGTGKSTLIESIRIALRCTKDLETEAPRVKEQLDRFMRPLQNKGVMLSDSEILLELQRRGKKYRLSWRMDGTGAELEEETADGWQEIDAGDLSSRFPVSVFSQKQINELASNPRGLLAIIDRAPEVNLSAWQTRWEVLKSQLIRQREKKRALERQLAEEPKIKSSLEYIENDLRQYEESGYGDILKQYQTLTRQKDSLPMPQILDDLSAELRRLSSTAAFPAFPSEIFEENPQTREEMEKIHNRSALALSEISEALEELAERIDTIKSQRIRAISESTWQKQFNAGTDAYLELVRQYESRPNPISLSVYGQWVQQRNQLQQQLQQLSTLRREADALGEEIENILKRLREMRKELFEKRRDFLDRVIGNNAFVRMELIPFGDTSTIVADYCNILGIDEAKFAFSLCNSDSAQGLLYDLSHWETNNIHAASLTGMIENMKKRSIEAAKSEIPSNAFEKRLKKIMDTKPALFDMLETWWPEDKLRVQYSKEPASGKFDDLERGSAGQKAAAILAFMLSHGDEPLVIDQPEDDLDNALIYDLIVKQIHENKPRRQLIIATHNPNIVVNGDAENIVALTWIGGQIQIAQQGSLNDGDIRDTICTIMEGGRQAFEKRYQRLLSDKT